MTKILKKYNKLLTTLFLVLTFMSFSNKVSAFVPGEDGGSSYRREATCYYEFIDKNTKGNFIELHYLNGSVIDTKIVYAANQHTTGIGGYSIVLEKVYVEPINFEDAKGDAGCPTIYYKYNSPLNWLGLGFNDHKYSISSVDTKEIMYSLEPNTTTATSYPSVIISTGAPGYKLYTVGYTNPMYGKVNIGNISLIVFNNKSISVSGYSFEGTKLSTSLIDKSGITYASIHDVEGNSILNTIYYCKADKSVLISLPNRSEIYEKSHKAKLSVLPTPVNADSPECTKLTNSAFSIGSDGINKSTGEGMAITFTTGTLTCTSFGTLMSFIYDFYRTILVYLGALLVLLGMLDFGKAAMSDSADSMKKATKAFTTRIIILVILFILPALLNIVFEMFKIVTCLPGI